MTYSYKTYKFKYRTDERMREQVRRYAEARNMALRELVKLYPHLFKKLYEEAKTQLDNERGPLPE